MRPLLLDLFCGEGGAAAGYYRAGLDVLGVDIVPQPRYPFSFVQADAVGFAARIDELGMRVAAIHASPPCQAHSDLQKQSKRVYPDLIEPTREACLATGLPFVIENVEGAPLIDAVMLCGTMFPGLRVIRHRLFEAHGFTITPPPHGRHPLVFTHDKRKAHYGRLDQDTAFVQVTGGGNATVANKRAAMGVPWMSGTGANEAIPPAYTHLVGAQLLEAIR